MDRKNFLPIILMFFLMLLSFNIVSGSSIDKFNLSGHWQALNDPSYNVKITGDEKSIHYDGSNGNYRHSGVLYRKGKGYEGNLKDVPGWCCGNEGYVWIEILDGDSIKSRSEWKRPGSKELFLKTNWFAMNRIKTGSSDGSVQTGKTPKINQDPVVRTYSSKPSVQAALSDEQTATIKKFGYPDTFSLMFFSIDDDTKKIYRREQWRFFKRFEELTFLNGDLVAQADLAPLPKTMKFPHYRPEAFNPNQSIEEIFELLGIMQFIKEEITDEFDDTIEIYRAPQISIGFSNGFLVSIETVPSSQ